MKYVYTVWFRNPALPADDQDYEWPACFMIDAKDLESAQRWGDRIAQKQAQALRQEMLSSEATTVEGSDLRGLDDLPTVIAGLDSDTTKIGW